MPLLRAQHCCCRGPEINSGMHIAVCDSPYNGVIPFQIMSPLVAVPLNVKAVTTGFDPAAAALPFPVLLHECLLFHGSPCSLVTSGHADFSSRVFRMLS